MSDPLLRVLILLICLVTGAFFAGMETGIVSINRLRLRHLVQRKVPAALVLDQFVRKPDFFLTTTLIGTNLSYVAAAILATGLSEKLHPTWGPVASSVLLSIVILIFCEYLPKAWFQSAPARRTMPLASTLYFFSRIFRPAGWVISQILQRILPASRTPPDEGQPMVTREELIHLTDEGRRTGSLTPVESRMIRNVFEVGGRRVGEIMIPRDRILSVHETGPATEALDLARNKEAKRFPVWNDERKLFTGIVHVFDILLDPEGSQKRISDFSRPAQTVSVREEIEHIMPRMRVSRQPMMLVVDERFDVVGLVTIEDVLREIVGHS
ncbi:MAG: hemolysin family protein [Kiritimatiellia bacterium]|nr:hemolysin family protein [Kiritimatiellia bacterium]